MAVEKRANIRVTAKTDQAVGEFKKLSASQDKAAQSMAKFVESARKKNAADADAARFAGFDKGAAQMAKNDAIMRQFSGTTAGLGAAFRGAAMGAGAFLAVAGVAASAVGELASRGLEVQGVFNALPFSIDRARTSTQGMISDFELAKSANQLVALGVVKTSDEFAGMAEAAQKLGSKLGMDTTRTLESLSAALGRGSTEMLDNLGIVLKMDQAHTLYAQQLGKTKAQLTETEKAEAFRVIAMQKINEAAKGITLTHDTAAASVARLGVEMDNMRDRALGAERPTVSLKEGIALLDEETRKLIPDTALHGDSLRKVQLALRDAGVATKDLTNAYRPYIDALAQVVAEQEKSAAWTSRSNKTIKEGMLGLAAATKSVNDFVAASNRSERGKDIERELALLGDNAKARASVNALLAEKAELTALGLEMEGKLDEAEKVRFAEELRQLRDLGASTVTVRTGTKGMTAAMREFNAELAKARSAGNSMSREGSDSREFAAEMIQAQQGMVGRTFAEARRQQMIDAVSGEERGNQALLEAKLQGLELQRAAGVDPWSIAQSEADARLYALHAQQNYIDQTLSGQERMMAHEEIAAQRRDVLHQLELQRLQRDLRAREQQRQRMQVVGRAVAQVHEGMAAAAIRGAFASGQSVRESVKFFAAGQAQEMTITGATELIRGAVATASFNYPAAAMHFTNAGLAFAQAATLGAVYGVASIGGGGRRGGGGGMSGPTTPSAGNGGGGTNFRGGSIGEGPPISRPSPAAPSPPRRGGGGNTVVINNNSLFPADTTQQMMDLRRALKRSEREDGDVN